MCGKSIIFGDKNIKEKRTFMKAKLFKIDGIDVNKILSEREPYDKKII